MIWNRSLCLTPQFNYAVSQLRDYYEDNEILSALEVVTVSLQNQISSPSAERTLAFRSAIDELKVAIRNVPYFSNLETFKSVIRETKGFDYFGEEFEKNLDFAISNQGLMPVEILSSLNLIKKNLTVYVSKITSLAETFYDLDVEYDDFQFGEYEFSALLPKELIGHTVSDIYKELSHLDKLFKALNEMLGYGATSPEVKSISSSWWQFFLNLDETQIAAITFAIERIVNLYKTSLEIKKLREDTKNLNLDKKITELIEKEIDKKIKAGMKKITADLRKKYQNNNDDQRVNELETQIRQELILVAKRLDQGAIYEVKAAIPDKPIEPLEADDDSAESLAEFEISKKSYQENLKNYEEKMKFINSINVVNTDILKISNSIKLDDNELITNYENIE
ncbi:MAG: hypothetical protein H7223_02380 [Pedobacter sp.]|nr:hypothetical protein [Pedobacter sp.]